MKKPMMPPMPAKAGGKKPSFGKPAMGMNCGGKVKKMAKGGGVEIKGKTKGKFC